MTNPIRILLAAVVASGAMVVTVLAPGGAQAANGDYTQILCANPDTGKGVDPEWTANQPPPGIQVLSSDNGWSADLVNDNCGTNALMSPTSALVLHNTAAAAYPTGTWAALSYRVTSPNITLEGGDIYRALQTTNAATSNMKIGQHAGDDTADPTSTPVNPLDTGDATTPTSLNRGLPSDPFAPANRVPLVVRDNRFVITARCAAAINASCNLTAEQWSYRVFGGRLRLHDGSPPTVSDVSGTSVTGDPVGSQVKFTAVDSGAGLYRLLAFIDGTRVAVSALDLDAERCKDVNPPNNDPYEFAAAQPCPTALNVDQALALGSIPEGDHRLQIQVEDAAGNTATVLDRTGYFSTDPTPRLIAPTQPSVTGAPRIGQTLTGSAGSWKYAKFFFRSWERCDEHNSCVPIAGASDVSYTVTESDIGQRLRYAVTAVGSPFKQATERSAMTAAVARDPVPAPEVDPGTDGGGAQPDGGTSPAIAPIALASTAPAGVGAFGAPPAAGTAAGVLVAAATPIKGAKLSLGIGAHRARRATIGYRTRSRLTGRVVDAGGHPVAGAAVLLTSRARAAGAKTVPLRIVHTGADGRFTATLAAGPSRQISARLGDATAMVTVTVKAKIFLTVGRARVSRTTRLAGRLLYAARAGIRLEVQALDGRRWRTFDTTTTGPHGRFRYGYRFKTTAAGRRFYLRVLVRSPVYPFAQGTSRAVRVDVK
jgi:hypothetical protein